MHLSFATFSSVVCAAKLVILAQVHSRNTSTQHTNKHLSLVQVRNKTRVGRRDRERVQRALERREMGLMEDRGGPDGKLEIN